MTDSERALVGALTDKEMALASIGLELESIRRALEALEAELAACRSERQAVRRSWSLSQRLRRRS